MVKVRVGVNTFYLAKMASGQFAGWKIVLTIFKALLSKLYVNLIESVDNLGQRCFIHLVATLFTNLGKSHAYKDFFFVHGIYIIITRLCNTILRLF
jgi:hypothetical protein